MNHSNNRCARQRGVTALSYGLLVGLIGIVALAAVTQTGSAGRELFCRTADTLALVSGQQGCAGSALPSSLSFVAHTCVSGQQAKLMSIAPNGDRIYMCEQDQSLGQPIGSYETTCLGPSDFAFDHFVDSGNQRFGAIAYEITPEAPITVISGGVVLPFSTANCSNGTCTTVTGPTPTSTVGTQRNLKDTQLCWISLDGQTVSAPSSTVAYLEFDQSAFGDGIKRIYDGAYNLYGTGSIQDASPVRIGSAYMSARPYQSTSIDRSFNAGPINENANYLERVAP